MATRKAKTSREGTRRKSGSAKNESPKNGSSMTGQVFPTVEQIRERAYERFLSRDASQGNEMGDWLDAERELMDSPRSGTQ
jgi:hypothetical protein